MARTVRITEYLDIDLDTETWHCNRCGHELGPARDDYKKGCLVYERNPRTIYDPVFEDGSFAPDPRYAASSSSTVPPAPRWWRTRCCRRGTRSPGILR
jgi:hypothetical protein